MTLFDLPKGQTAKIIIKSVSDSYQELFLRLNHMGFVPGEVVELCEISPLFKGSVLVSVRGSRIALSQVEAKAINIEPLEK